MQIKVVHQKSLILCIYALNQLDAQVLKNETNQNNEMTSFPFKIAILSSIRAKSCLLDRSLQCLISKLANASNETSFL